MHIALGSGTAQRLQDAHQPADLPLCVRPHAARTVGRAPITGQRAVIKGTFATLAAQRVRGRYNVHPQTWIFMHRVPHGECPHMPHRARWVKRSSQCRRPFTWQRGRAPRQHRTPDQPDRSVHQSGIPLLSVTATVRDNAHRSGWASSRKHWPYKAWSRILSFRHFPPSPFRGDLIDLPCPGTRGHLNYSSGCGGRSPCRPR